MKNFRINGLFACLLLSMAFFSCQKQKISAPATGVASKDGTESQKSALTCNHPLFADKVISSSCSQGHTCAPWMITTSKRNNISFRVANGCGNDYVFYGVPVAYHIYKYIGMSGTYEQYQEIANFSCISTNVAYASSLLTNTTNFIILAEEQPTTTYPTTIYWQGGWVYSSPTIPLTIQEDAWRFTTLNYYGLACDVHRD